MRKLIALLACLALLAPAPALAQGVPLANTVSSCGAASYPAGQQRPITQDTGGNQCINDAGGGGGAVTANQGTPNAGGATNSWPIQGAGTAGTPAGGVVSIQGVASGTVVPVVPSASTTGGATHAQTSVLASNLVAKGSAGNLYSFTASADSTLSGAAWWLMIFDATTLPGNGTVTPAGCIAAPSGATTVSGEYVIPASFTAGITLGVSTTGCFSLTASTHAFISASYQ